VDGTKENNKRINNRKSQLKKNYLKYEPAYELIQSNWLDQRVLNSIEE